MENISLEKVKKKILHIFNFETKFSKDYFDFLGDNGFNLSNHSLFHYGKVDTFFDKFNFNYTFSKSYFSIWKHIKLLRMMFNSNKIIAHNLASPWLLLYLYLFPKLTPKVYWVIWGKDLYFYQLLEKKFFYHRVYEFFRKKVFKNISQIITYVDGDAKLAYDWYSVNAKIYKSFMYPSNLYKSYNTTHNKNISKPLNIQVGNSADPSNNHENVFLKLLKYRNDNIHIFAPLSYGDVKHAEKINKLGKNLFGSKFTPLNKFLKPNEYVEYLNNIDIAIFAQKRQQALGNIITLIGLGKTVYLRKDVSTWALFENISVKVKNIENLTLNLFNSNQIQSNITIIKDEFSPKNLKEQQVIIFAD